jgi:hypothetical protein
VQSVVIVGFDYMRFAAKCTLQNLQPKKERAVVSGENGEGNLPPTISVH